MQVPIYRPEITTYERDEDGLWVSKQGTITSTLFYPMPDRDSVNESGLRVVVEHGADPFFTIVAPDGSRLEITSSGSATFLSRRGKWNMLRMPGGKAHDATNALCYAKRGEFGLSLLGRKVGCPVVEVPPIVPKEIERPIAAELIKARPWPAREKVATKQLSLFG